MRASAVAVWSFGVATMLGVGSLSAQDTRPPAGASRDIPMSAAIRRAHAAGTRDSSGRPGRNYWQLRTAYTIRARLDSSTSIVSGTESVVLYNTSPVPLETIQLRLDQNRFRRGASTDDPRHQTDGMTVTRLVVAGEAASIGDAASTRAPRLSGTRNTSERITLFRAIQPRDSVSLEIDWHFTLPLDDAGNALRLGRTTDKVYQVGQWYPRIAMFDDLNGWDTTSYTGAAEFYNPYGRFDVRLDVPGGWLVGATGMLQNPAEVLAARTRDRLGRALGRPDSTTMIVGLADRGAGKATLARERLVWHFVADSVSDFAWGASAQYLWMATRVDIRGRPPSLGHMLLRPANASKSESAGATIRTDLAANSAALMPYGFPQHTLIDGPEGGMEYPMITMSGGDDRLSHELWHQWFPMMIGTNETWYAFMDEGFTGAVGSLTGSVSSSGGISRTAPLIWPDDRGPPDWKTGVYAYSLPSQMFGELGALVGQQAVLDALRGYATAWRFKHPSPWDFMFFMNRALGRNLDDFWYKWLFT